MSALTWEPYGEVLEGSDFEKMLREVLQTLQTRLPTMSGDAPWHRRCERMSSNLKVSLVVPHNSGQQCLHPSKATMCDITRSSSDLRLPNQNQARHDLFSTAARHACHAHFSRYLVFIRMTIRSHFTCLLVPAQDMNGK